MERGSTAAAVRSHRQCNAVVGAAAGAVGVLAVMPFFYPFGRVFDPAVGGDTPTGLPTELALGFIGGLLLVPVAGLIGGAVAYVVGPRRVGPAVALVLIASGTAFAIGLLAILNNGFTDENGSLRSLQRVAALGSLAGTVAVAVYKFAQRVVLPRLATQALREHSTSGST